MSQKKRLKAAFDKLDTDHDGRIRLSILHQGLEEIDTKNALTFEEKQRLLWKRDENDDKYVNVDDFIQMATPSPRPPPTSDNPFPFNPDTGHTRRFTAPPRLADSRLERSRKLTWRAVAAIHPPIPDRSPGSGSTEAGLDEADQSGNVEPYYKDYSCCPPPVFMLIISIAQVAVFVAYCVTLHIKPTWLTGCPGCFTAKGGIGPLVFFQSLKKQAWRYISYMFIHAGIEHIVMNQIMQLILGIPLELVHKPWRIAPLYLCGVVLGSLIQGGLDPSVILVGASGGGYALLLAHLANCILNWSEMPFRIFRVIFVAALIGADVGQALYRRLGLKVCDQVSYLGHLGGAATGLLLGIAVLRNLRTVKWEKIMRIISLILYVLLMIGFIVLNVIQKPGAAPIFSTKCVTNQTRR